jgi:probable phosphoglycerate mutase
MNGRAPAPRYWILRHGHSEANAQGRVVSDPRNGRDAYGLTDAGRRQVRKTLTEARDRELLTAPVSIVSSPFLRTVQSARLAAEILGVPEFTRDERLSERFFGALELGHDRVYPEVWEADRRNPNHTCWEVESVVAVQARLAALLADLDRSRPERTVLLVAHGDIASVLLCWAAARDLREHREVGPLETAALVRVRWARDRGSVVDRQCRGLG